MRMALRRKKTSAKEASLNRREFLASTAGVFSAIAALGVLLVARPSKAAPPRPGSGRNRRRRRREELTARPRRRKKKKKAASKKK